MKAANLEYHLNRPAADETFYDPPGDADRLGALSDLAALQDGGSPSADGSANRPRHGVNTHVHTGKSFSLFFSPAAACWRAYKEGIEFFGINDHYTVAGHAEFREACRILGIKALFSMEAIAMHAPYRKQGILLNDPDNPGRTYFTAKGVTKYLTGDDPQARRLKDVNAALERRHQEMSVKSAAWLREHTADTAGIAPITDFGWRQVLGRTPHGNVTERHIAGAVAERLFAAIDEKHGFSDEFAEMQTPRDFLRAVREHVAERLAPVCGDWFDEVPPDVCSPVSETTPELFVLDTPHTSGAFQSYIRGKLLKAGRPCYVEESPDAYLSLDDLRDMYLAMGAIPTYPILGNPITGGEQDIEKLLDEMLARGVYAFEVIPRRNTRERLREILSVSQARHVPLFTGSEHNTLDDIPLLDPLAIDDEFLPYFERSANVLLGHQQAVRTGSAGFVRPDGKPDIGDARERFEHFEALGRSFPGVGD